MLQRRHDNTNILLDNSMLLWRSINICTTLGSTDVHNLPRHTRNFFGILITAAFFFLFVLWLEAVWSHWKFIFRRHFDKCKQRSDVTKSHKNNMVAYQRFLVKKNALHSNYLRKYWFRINRNVKSEHKVFFDTKKFSKPRYLNTKSETYLSSKNVQLWKLRI